MKHRGYLDPAQQHNRNFAPWPCLSPAALNNRDGVNLSQLAVDVRTSKRALGNLVLSFIAETLYYLCTVLVQFNKVLVHLIKGVGKATLV